MHTYVSFAVRSQTASSSCACVGVCAAFPHNAELSTINAATLLAGADLTHQLDARYNLPQKHVLSQRDVPGFPRGAVGAAVAANITALSEGMNGRIVPPLVAPAFRWRDASAGPDGAEVLVWWHGKYKRNHTHARTHAYVHMRRLLLGCRRLHRRVRVRVRVCAHSVWLRARP